jgi:two-component system CheB/CheR fusion protein
MQVTGAADLGQYRDFLATVRRKRCRLLQDMLISVTHFFRDPAAFATLQSQVLPRLFDGLRGGEDLRVWVVGCATGEESYAIACCCMKRPERRARPVNVQIFATDINEAALAVARRGTYPAAIAADVSASRLTRYFQPEGDQYRVIHALRDPVLFAKHNLLGDPPFSRLDLVCCRNLLIYLDGRRAGCRARNPQLCAQARRLPVPGQLGVRRCRRRPVHGLRQDPADLPVQFRRGANNRASRCTPRVPRPQPHRRERRPC